MKDRKKLLILSLLALTAVALFMFYGLNSNNYEYNLSKRIPRVIAIIVTGGSIAFSSILFQTITNNRIITPGILGLDSMYGFLQSFMVFVFGTSSIVMTNSKVNFLLSLLFMIGGMFILYSLIIKKERFNVYVLLLIGTIFGTFFRSLSTYLQVLIDPNDYETLQNKLFASFSNIHTELLLIVIIILLIMFAFIYDDFKKLDPLLLGRENAINLGIDYDKISRKSFVIIGILVAISTALVGPITFLGILVVNLSYEFISSFRHKYLVPCAMLISITSLVGGQFIVEKVLNYSSKVSIIINFIGGIYFIYLLLRENKND